MLFAVAAGVTALGIRMPLPARLPRPSRSAATGLFVLWVAAITAFLACATVYVQKIRAEHLRGAGVSDPISPFTYGSAAVTFLVIFVLDPDRTAMRILTAAIGAIAGPMIFELPFDLIVMARTYPAVQPDPGLYRVLFFAPLFVIELTTLSFLTLSPMVKLARATFFSFALMLIVFAVWALEGFQYPNTPVPFTLNLVSKFIAFATVLTLFVPQRARREYASAPTTSLA